MEVSATTKYVKMSPTKARDLAGTIVNKILEKYSEASR